MNDTTKEKSSEQKTLKNRILNLKKRKYDLKKKSIPISPYKNQNFFLKRPNSNYIPRISNNILEQSKMNSFNNKINAPNKILVNRKISTSDIHGNNSISFINSSQRRIKNYIYYEDQNAVDKSRINYFKENNIPKSAKNELKISKSFLNNNVTFTKIYSKEIQKGIRGCKSPLNYSFRNKYLDIAKELLGGKKFNKEHRIQNSPSTTNNSNFNDNNSYSSHFLFGKSLMNLNIYPKGINNYFFVDNKYTNKEYKNFGENSKISSPKLNKINKLLLKKDKEKENLIKTKESFYQYQLNKQKKNQNDISRIRNIPFNIGIKSKITQDISSYVNLDFTEQSKNIIKSSKYIERKKEPNPKRINKKINLIIKYAFLSKAIQDIKRKVDFVNPKNGEKITLNTTNIQNNNENTTNKDFTIVGYEVSPQDVYKLYQNNTKKKEKITVKKESQTQTKYFNMDNEDKIISPKFFVSQQYEKKLKNKEIKKPEIQKQKSSGETSDYIRNKKDIIFDIIDGIDINNFGLGESINKNKLDYNMITDNDKKEGKKLWSKIYKSSINIFNKKNSNLNIKSKIDSDSKKIEKIKRIKSAKIKGGKNVKKRKLNQKDTVQRKQKKNFSQKIESLEQHKLMRNEGGFIELKNEEKNIYNIDFKITDESDDDTINEVIAEKKRKEKQERERERENMESIKENQNTRNSHKKRNTIVDSNPFNNKLYKIKKTNSKIINNLNKIEAKASRITHNNKKAENNTKQKDGTKLIKNQIPNISYYNKKINQKKGYDKIIKYHSNYINKITKKKTKKEKASLKKEKSEQHIINILKNNSMEIRDDKIWDELYSSIDSEYGAINLSCENKYDNIKYENVIKKSKKNPSTLLFERFFKSCRMNKEYKEDEKMEKYFNDIFNKYDKDDELVDVKFFGFDFKIKRKNQINFKNIFMKNIREQNILQKENKIIYTKLSLILERFNKTKIKTYNKNLEIYKASKIKRLQKIKSRIKLKKESEKIKKAKNDSIEEKKEEFQSQMFFGVKMNSMDEFERKKDELLILIEDKIRDGVKKGEMGQVEMRKFLDFQKRMNAYQIDKNNKNSFIQLLEQEFISFQERMKIYEQKLKEERRLNKFLNELNDGFERDFYYKNFHKKMFCNVINYKEKNNINLLSSTKYI